MQLSDVEDWTSLPGHIFENIFHRLPFGDRYSASLVCKAWSEIFDSPYLWEKVFIYFHTPQDRRFQIFATKFGRYFKDVSIELSPIDEHNRRNACDCLRILLNEPSQEIEERAQLRHLKITFLGDNPLFYNGQEFSDILKIFFARTHALRTIDLGGLNIMFDSDLLDSISANNSHLEVCNIENKTIVCKVHPRSTERLAQCCHDLRELTLFYCSLDNGVLLALAAACPHLRRLAITCRRSEKFGVDLSARSWTKLTSSLPSLRVALRFDPTCPVNIINMIMKAEIPVSELRLEIYCHVHEQLNQATLLYADTLELLAVNTPSLAEFNESLLAAVRTCLGLRTLLIYCRLPQAVIDEVLRIRPDIKEARSYVLRSAADPEDLWVVGKEFD